MPTSDYTNILKLKALRASRTAQLLSLKVIIAEILEPIWRDPAIKDVLEPVDAAGLEKLQALTKDQELNREERQLARQAVKQYQSYLNFQRHYQLHI